MNLTMRNKADILAALLHEAYCCYRRSKFTEHLVNNGNSKVQSRIISSNGEMKKYIKLSRIIADDLGIEYIDWENPSKFPTYVF